MKMNITIFNNAQLEALSKLVRENTVTSYKLLSGEITFTFNLFEFLFTEKLILSKDLLSNESTIINAERVTFSGSGLKFYSPDKTGKVIIDYDQENKVLVDHSNKNGDKDIVHLLNDTSVGSYTNDSEQENAERAFLNLVNQDLSDGYCSDNVKHFRKMRNNIYFAVFGQE